MEVSGYLHAPVSLPLEMELPVPIEHEADWTTIYVWTMWSRQSAMNITKIPQLLSQSLQ
jgi:hypothetical protein